MRPQLQQVREDRGKVLLRVLLVDAHSLLRSKGASGEEVVTRHRTSGRALGPQLNTLCKCTKEVFVFVVSVPASSTAAYCLSPTTKMKTTRSSIHKWAISRSKRTPLKTRPRERTKLGPDVRVVASDCANATGTTSCAVPLAASAKP